MPIGVINVTNLVRVRRTLRPRWRIFISITFLLFVFLWWAAINRIENSSRLVEDGNLRLQAFIIAGVLLLVLIVAFFRKDDFARLVFALITVFSILSVIPFLLVAVYAVVMLAQRGIVLAMFACFALFFAVVMCLELMILHGYVLLLSLMPFTRLKAYRQQVVYSLRLWSGQWKGPEESQVVEASERLHLIPGTRYRLALGFILFVLGIAIILFALVDFVISNSSLDISWSQLLIGFAKIIAFLLPGSLCLVVFRYFWTQWQSENTPVYRVPLLKHMTSSDLLLLRSFKDDVKYVVAESSYRVSAWGFTFEQLIVNRLSYLGKARLIDIDQENDELLDKWPEKWRLSFFVKALGEDKLKKLLISVLPAVWYKLPAKGGIRYYIDTQGDKQKWQEEIEKAMSMARMIVVTLGSTPSLNWEMKRIRELNLWEKTVFVMPPLYWKKNYRARWQQFIDEVCRESRAYDEALLKKVDPKRVLAVCVREDALIIIIRNKNGKSQLLYESAIDVATLFTITDPLEAHKLIPKYLA